MTSNFRKLSSVIACAVSCLAGAQLAQAAVVVRTFTVSGVNGTTGSGSFSFDNSVVGANYNSGMENHGELLSFSLTLGNIPGGGVTSTSYTFTDINGPLLGFQTDENGDITEFGPVTSDDYLAPYALQLDHEFVTNIFHISGGVMGAQVDTITYTLNTAAIPEPSTCAALAGAAVLGLAAWRRKSRAA